MSLSDHPTYYDVLDLNPDASPQEVREAYLRTKSAYNKDSVALYTLIDADEREDMLYKIEEAYEVLSNPERRKEYDRHHGLLSAEQDFQPKPAPAPGKKIISIDRVPPMESGDGESMLISPPTDFTGEIEVGNVFHSSPPPPTSAFAQTDGPTARTTMPQPQVHYSDSPGEAPGAGSSSAPTTTPSYAKISAVEAHLAQEIAQEIEWRGPFLKKVRETRRISIEELSNNTKISKTYILAIEEENFPRLPAPVYLRGFIVQIAKILKVPSDKVAAAYMARYYQAYAAKTR